MNKKINFPDSTQIWSEWINKTYFQPDQLIELRNWYQKDGKEVLILPNFLNSDKALFLYECLKKIKSFEPIYSLCWGKNGQEYKDVSKNEFLKAKVINKFGSHEKVTDLNSVLDKTLNGLSNKEQKLMNSFFYFFVIGIGLKSWISLVVSQKTADKVSFEIVRYGQNDFLSPHYDTHDNRLIGVNFYLDPNWKKSHGGILSFKKENNKVLNCNPQFNSLSLIPISNKSKHWVSPWNSKEKGRYTVSMSFRPNEQKEILPG